MKVLRLLSIRQEVLMHSKLRDRERQAAGVWGDGDGSGAGGGGRNSERGVGDCLFAANRIRPVDKGMVVVLFGRILVT